jgi:predicted naringenin-chalcone synthase
MVKNQLNSIPSSTFINQIETAIPPHEIHQSFLRFVPQLMSQTRDRDIFKRLAAKSQIQSRYSFIKTLPSGEQLDTEGFYRKAHFPTTAARMEKYKLHALELASLAILPVLKSHSPESFTHLIVTSCTGFYAPGLDLEILKEFKFLDSTQRTLIGFMGCYAGVIGLRSAYHAIRSQPQSKVLMINLELCTLHFQEKTDFPSLLSFLQFADGCAASVISAEPQGIELTSFRTDLMLEEGKLIQWHIGDSGFDMVLALESPQVLGKKLRELAPIFSADTEIWAIHPGGRSILDAVESSFALQQDALKDSREVLRDFGNMSSATLLFVLQRIFNNTLLNGEGIAMAFGPGLSIESFRFHKHLRKKRESVKN